MLKRFNLFLILFFFSPLLFAQNKILNIYAWTNEVPGFLVRQFQKETDITVNISYYDTNETMYAKLRASKNAGYDIVMPSSYYVERMRQQNMLASLDPTKIPNLKYLNSKFLKPAYDPSGQYSVPFIWGVTGMFQNTNVYKRNISKWANLWDKTFRNQLLLLDDVREVFSMGLLTLGYPANDENPEHIKEAFLKLKQLIPNIKVFTTDMAASIIVDEDANVGMVWNGDAYKAFTENSHVKFIYPEEGFVIWVDNFAIPLNAQHKAEAYQFINFMMRPDVSRAAAMYTNFPITNEAAHQLLPEAIRNNPTIYPSSDILKRGQFQRNVSDATLALYDKYWEELKLGG